MEKTVETGAFSREKIGEFIKDYGAIIGIVIILFVFQIFDHRFLRPANIWGVCKSSAFLIMMALGMTLVMSVRGIDFSIAQVADASAVISAYLILHDVDPMLAIVITLAWLNNWFGKCGDDGLSWNTGLNWNTWSDVCYTKL